MKRLFLNIICLMMVYCLQGQTPFQINGTVTRSSDGSAVADWLVFVYAPNPSDSSLLLFESAITDASGAYQITANIMPGMDELNVGTFDGCLNAPDEVLQQIVLTPSGQATVNFEICGDLPVQADCEAYFWSTPASGLTIDFMSDFYAIDDAPAATYSWDFGDGFTSNEAAPSHTYAAAGEYLVTLTITSETGCTATAAFPVFVFDQPPFPDCWAWIDVMPSASGLTFGFSAQYFGLDSADVAVSWLWDFGDGTTSTEENPTHTFAANGFYFVHLTVTGSNGCVATADFPFSTDFPPFPNCLTYITYNQTSTTSFDFSALVYTANGDSANVVSYAWDFGDGDTSNEANPSHTYSDEGIYNVQLTVETDNGCEAYACEVVFAYDCQVDTFWYGCQAMFAIGYGGPNLPPGAGSLTVDFYDVSLGAAQTWAWDFGDGATSTEQNPVHTYAEEGEYIVSLAITTLDGCESEIEFAIYVGDDFPWIPEPDCQALFIPMPDFNSGNGIQFIDVSFSPNPIQSWAWDFGDGNTSTDQNPYHVYAQPGVYTVTLEIAADSCSSVISFDIDTQDPWNFSNQPAKLAVAAGTTSTRDNTAFEGLQVYPNPAITDLNAAFSARAAGEYEIRISDLTGKTILNVQQQAATGVNAARLDVGQLVPGLYLIELRTPGSVVTRKFIKG